MYNNSLKQLNRIKKIIYDLIIRKYLVAEITKGKKYFVENDVFCFLDYLKNV